MINLKQKTSIAVLVLFHVIGLIGIGLCANSELIRFTPLILLISITIILINQPSTKVFRLFLLTYIASFCIEAIGVYSGLPFGNYSYGSMLGWKLFGTPLIIGVNWVILLYGACTLASKLDLSLISKSLVTGALMVFLDYLIEPVAIDFDFWTWEVGYPPLENYLAWFVVSTVLAIPWHLSKIEFNMPIGISVYSTELLFFGILNFV